MPTYNFEEVAVTATKRWKDAETGRPRQQTKKFWKTLNPFNVNADGTPRTRAQIIALLIAERDQWLTQREGC